MANFDSLPEETGPLDTDNVFMGRGSGAGAERKASLSSVRTLFKNLYVQSDNPVMTTPGMWVQTQAGSGEDITIWINDGT